jgi:hypothetical protein
VKVDLYDSMEDHVVTLHDETIDAARHQERAIRAVVDEVIRERLMDIKRTAEDAVTDAMLNEVVKRLYAMLSPILEEEIKLAVGRAIK